MQDSYGRNNTCRVGPTNWIWKFYDNATSGPASITRKRCHRGTYELAVPFGFTTYSGFTMFKIRAAAIT